MPPIAMLMLTGLVAPTAIDRIAVGPYRRAAVVRSDGQPRPHRSGWTGSRIVDDMRQAAVTGAATRSTSAAGDARAVAAGFDPAAIPVSAIPVSATAVSAWAIRASDPAPPAALILPGREEDARVAAIADRLAIAGRARCPVLRPVTGVLLQHLSQFDLADRAALVAALPLDRGPGVIAVTPDGPGAAAGLRAGDVLLAIDGRALPPEPGLADPFDAARARARADVVQTLLAGGDAGPRAVTLLRDGARVSARIEPRPGCPSQVHLARSDQRNAYADGVRVLLTTGLLRRLANDDELAFVVAHEMAHDILGHAAVMRGGAVRRGIGRTLGRSGAIVRAAEREADALAGERMLDAGFDPGRGAEALRRTGGGDLGIGLFAAHAPTGVRIAAMRALAGARRAR